MSENEIRNEEKKCNCEKKELCRFLQTILGSFLGCLVALCLYGAAVKPQPPQPCPMFPPRFEAPRPYHFDAHRPRGEFKCHKMKKHNFDKKRGENRGPKHPVPPVKKEVKPNK